MNTTALQYSLGLYVLYFVLPLIPAILLFLLFPKSKVALSGPLQDMTVNATGAVAVYFVTLLLGFPEVQHVRAQIEELTKDKVWTVQIPIQLEGADRKTITTDKHITDGMVFGFDQHLYRESGGGSIRIAVPIENEQWRTINIDKDGFIGESVGLESLINNNDPTKVTIDTGKRFIDVREAVILKQAPTDRYIETQPPLAEKSLGEVTASLPTPQ